jgi:hypothetical protein
MEGGVRSGQAAVAAHRPNNREKSSESVQPQELRNSNPHKWGQSVGHADPVAAPRRPVNDRRSKEDVAACPSFQPQHRKTIHPCAQV